MNKFSIFTTFLFMFTLAGCNYNQVVMNLDQSISYDLKFDNLLVNCYYRDVHKTKSINIDQQQDRNKHW